MARIAIGSGGYMDRTLVFTDNTAQIDLEGLPLDWYTLALIDQMCIRDSCTPILV